MRNGKLIALAVLAILTIVWLGSGRLSAAEEKGGQSKAAAHGHAAEGEPEAGPQIFTPIRIDLGIWTLVVFLLLLAVLTKYAWNPMLGALQKREENIRGALDEAQRAREEAHKLRDQLQGEMSQAQEKVRDILDEARRDAQRASEDLIAKARADIQAERDRLHREIGAAKDQALKQLWDQTAQLATLVSAKAIRRQLTPEDHRRLVDEALVELRAADGARTS